MWCVACTMPELGVWRKKYSLEPFNHTCKCEADITATGHCRAEKSAKKAVKGSISLGCGLSGLLRPPRKGNENVSPWSLSSCETVLL